jgi:large repetitive protein
MGRAASLLAVLGLLTSLLTVSQTLMSAPASASGTIWLISTGDTYLPGVLTSAINLSAPEFSSSSDTATDVTGNSPAGPGDTVQYDLTIINSGDDPSTTTVVSDPLPPTVTFVPGSLATVAADGSATPLTDTAGDDQAELFDPATNAVTARLGCGADASTGGVIVSASTTNSTCTTTQTSLIFRARVGEAGSPPVTDGPRLNDTAQTSGVNGSYDVTPPSTSDTGSGSNVVQNQGGPAVAISDVASSVVPSATAGYRVSVQYRPDSAPDGTLTVNLPPGLDNPAVGLDTTSLQTPDVTSNCSIAGLVLTCSIGSLDDGAEVVLDIQGVAASSLPDGAQLTATACMNTDPADTGLISDPATAQITVRTASRDAPDSTTTASTTTAPTTTTTTTALTTTTTTTAPTTTAPATGPPASNASPPPAPPAAPPPTPWSAAIQAPLVSALPALPDAAIGDPVISMGPPPTVVIPSAAPPTEMPPSIAPANVASPDTAPDRAPAAPPSVAPPRAPDPPALPALFERLAATGSNPFAGAGVAVILLVAGLVLMVASGVRRRR